MRLAGRIERGRDSGDRFFEALFDEQWQTESVGARLLDRLSMSGMQDHSGRGPVASDQLRCEEPIHDQHLDIEQGDVGLMREDKVDGLPAVRSLADNVEGRNELEQGASSKRVGSWSSAITTRISAPPCLLPIRVAAHRYLSQGCKRSAIALHPRGISSRPWTRLSWTTTSAGVVRTAKRSTRSA